jgi:hypothetical protein
MDWQRRELPEDAIGTGGRMMRQKAEDRHRWFGEAGNPFWANGRGRDREREIPRENREEGRGSERGWQRGVGQQGRRQEAEAEQWVEMESPERGNKFGRADDRRFGDGLRGRTFCRMSEAGEEEESRRNRRLGREEAESGQSGRRFGGGYGRRMGDPGDKLETRIAALEKDREALERAMWRD